MVVYIPIAEGNTLLYRMGVLVITETLDGDDMLAIDGAERGQAGVDIEMPGGKSRKGTVSV
jgi:hypothetical protein